MSFWQTINVKLVNLEHPESVTTRCFRLWHAFSLFHRPITTSLPALLVLSMFDLVAWVTPTCSRGLKSFTIQWPFLNFSNAYSTDCVIITIKMSWEDVIFLIPLWWEQIAMNACYQGGALSNFMAASWSQRHLSPQTWLLSVNSGCDHLGKSAKMLMLSMIDLVALVTPTWRVWTFNHFMTLSKIFFSFIKLMASLWSWWRQMMMAA